MNQFDHRDCQLDSWCSAASWRLCVVTSVILAAMNAEVLSYAQVPPLPPPDNVAVNKAPLVEPQARYALIVVGIPGDEVRSDRFREIVTTLQEWLGRFARVTPENTFVLAPDSESRSDADTLREVTTELSRKVRADDALWVFSIGHGSVDKRSAWFHIPGPDLNDAQWADLCAQFRAKEQVYWFTHSGSGRFVKSLSRPQRVVIAATDPEEVNETRFPVILADVMNAQLAAQQETGKPVAGNSENPAEVSVLSLFKAVCDGVDSQFQSENLVPTEHGRLDDNGDGTGTEAPDLNTDIASIDGGLANRIVIQLQRAVAIEPIPKNTSSPDLQEGKAAP